jgi:diguanylate cyclase (GGDEF)-like protein
MKKEENNRGNAVYSPIRLYLFIFFILLLFSVLQTRIYFLSYGNEFMGTLFSSLAVFITLIIILAAILTVFVAIFLNLILIRPLKELSIAARKIARGDFSVHVPSRCKDRKKNFFVEVLSDDFNNMTKELASATKKLEALSTTDELTKLDNRRSFLEYMDIIWKQNHRLNLPVTALMIDIDFFKKYNDSLGHLEGDKALIAVAQCIKNQIKRETDFVARIGGEEFICLLPFVDKSDALDFANTLVQSVENMKMSHPMNEHSKYVTISAGIASIVPNDNNSYTQLLDEADKALYMAKETGRNRIVMNKKEDILPSGSTWCLSQSNAR